MQAWPLLQSLRAASAAQAQSTLPPADVQNAPAAPTQANAQGDIVVTGSRIRRDPLDHDAPRVFVDQADIAKTGLNSTNDVLQRLPSSGGGLNGKFNNSGNFGNPPDGGGVGAGAAEIDLRYLGSRRVLVLVDGLRYVNGASASGVPGSVDLNSIPESMIERVEVLQDGASAIYGSDAIAGVVNIITKSSQKGFVALRPARQVSRSRATASPRITSSSWGNGDDGATADRRRRQLRASRTRSARATARSRLFPTPGATACDATCSARARRSAASSCSARI